MSKDRELLQQALEALETYHGTIPGNTDISEKTIESIRARLAEPEETGPVAWMGRLEDEGAAFTTKPDNGPQFDCLPFYPHPPSLAARLSDSDILPLIDMEIEDYLDGGYAKSSYLKSNLQDFARAIETAVLRKNGLEVKKVL